ncbi:MAG: YfhO family protein, partial [Melioribacteraceae bacterium]|nr:YfhO family protein [Melioribacteraceae bacterium]
DYKWVVSILSAGIFLTLAILFMSDSFSYATAVDAQRYDTNTLNIVKDIRQEFLIADTQKLLMFLAAATIILAAFLMKKIKVEIFVILILLVSLIEIFTVSNRAHNYIPLNNPEKLEESVFKETSITRILSKADDSYRAIVLGRDFTNNHYAYFYPLISGYSAIKLQVIQDVVSHNLYNAPSEDKLNWNIINMMGGKFIISPTKLNNDSLTTLAVDNEKKQVLYLNPNALPKSWFVKKLKQFNAPEDVVVYMNTPEFDPSYIALMVIENPIPQSDSSLDFSIEKSYTGNGQVKLISHNPNKVELDVNIFSTQFLVLSEIYYPKGWTAKLDGEEIDIHKINHLLRGVEIGKGNHKLIFEFEPKTYYASLTSLWIGNLLTLLIILMGIYFVILKKRKLEGEKK